MLHGLNPIKSVFREKAKKGLFLGLLVLIMLSVQAQRPYNVNVELTTESNTINYKLPGQQFYPIYVPSGSEFYDDQWMIGYVILENEDRYDSLMLKYNTYRDEIITVNDRARTMIMLDKDAITEFGLYEMPGVTKRFKKMDLDKIPKAEHYFNLPYDGNLKFAVWYRTLEETTAPFKDKNGYLQISDFVLRHNYYILFPDGQFEKFKLNRQSLIQLFPDHKREIRRMLRRDRNWVKTEDDAARAIEMIEKQFFTFSETK